MRLGGTVTLEDAWRNGFDHVCVATGAGLPRVIPMGHSLARGMRQASDFLMALQLTGAAKESSLATLQVRLPAVVIGGGLTAVDTATEVQAYYVKQVEKVLARTEAVGVGRVQAGLGDEDGAILDDLLAHGRAVRAERERAAGGGRGAGLPSLHPRLGRCDARVPQGHERLPRLSPQPRRDHQGRRRGHLLRQA